MNERGETNDEKKKEKQQEPVNIEDASYVRKRKRKDNKEEKKNKGFDNENISTDEDLNHNYNNNYNNDYNNNYNNDTDNIGDYGDEPEYYQNETMYRPMRKKRKKFFNLFNIFNWIKKKNVNMPSKEIECISDASFLNFNNVLCKNFGAKVLFVTDESISLSENLMNTDKLGWITRRRRDVGHEWLILRLKFPCIIYGIELDFDNMEDDICPHLSIEVVENYKIDDIIKEEEFIITETEEKSHNVFKKDSYNFLESYKIDKSISDLLENEKTPWMELLQADCVDFLTCVKKKKVYFFEVNDSSLFKPWTHIRINLYPDGGLNNIKFYGEFISLFKKHTILSKQKIFLNKPENGCTLIYYKCNDTHKGHPKYLIDSYQIEGFCTKRLVDRPPIILRTLASNSINNVAIFKFGVRGIIENFTIDIGEYKMDHPEAIQIYLLDCFDILTLDLFEQQKIFEEDEKLENPKIDWFQLPLYKINTLQKKSFYNFNLLERNYTVMDPDGGISQVNVIGTVLTT
ncbi:allantoicase, putative, partial [Hepatocystis sp. ex Piliocolobus tephrosceles]